MADKTRAQKQGGKVKNTNVIESLKDVGGSAVDSIKRDLLSQAPKDFLQQLLGTRPVKRNYSGEVSPGESLELRDVFSGKAEEEIKVKKQLHLERRLREEEEKRSNEKIATLRVQLNALMKEVEKLAKETQGLAEETQIATMQAPVEPGVYHIIFFEKLLEFLRSFREKIHEASVWLHATNTRAEKKNYWARYKKHGSKFLLSGEHYLTRSAG